MAPRLWKGARVMAVVRQRGHEVRPCVEPGLSVMPKLSARRRSLSEPNASAAGLAPTLTVHGVLVLFALLHRLTQSAAFARGQSAPVYAVFVAVSQRRAEGASRRGSCERDGVLEAELIPALSFVKPDRIASARPMNSPRLSRRASTSTRTQRNSKTWLKSSTRRNGTGD